MILLAVVSKYRLWLIVRTAKLCSKVNYEMTVTGVQLYIKSSRGSKLHRRVRMICDSA